MRNVIHIFNPSLLTLLLLSFSVACSNSGFQTTGGGDTVTNPATSSSTGNSPAPGATAGTSAGTSSLPTTTPVAVYQYEPLVWESTSHPERAQWSSSLYQIIATSFSTLDKAQDIKSFCPDYASLTQNQKINLWADLFAADSYYESGWDPANYSVDVGTANDNTTWSVGLLQMSVVDIQNYNLPFNFNFTDLQNPVKNLELAVAVMAKQITNHGIVLIPVGSSGLYWSTLHPGGQYDQSANIIKMTEKLSFCHP